MSRTILFLDIDGVLYPCNGRRFILRNTQDIRSALKAKGYRSMEINDGDLCSVAYGFDTLAVQYLKQLIQQTNVEVVISSSWKFSRSLETLKALFSLYEMDGYISDITANHAGFMKEPAIQEYLEMHPDIERYVILDDIDLRPTFKQHAIVCPDVFDEESYQKALEILKNR